MSSVYPKRCALFTFQKRARVFLGETFLIAPVDRKKGNSEKPTSLGIF